MSNYSQRLKGGNNPYVNQPGNKEDAAFLYSGLLLGNKRNKAFPHVTTWINLNNITQSKRSQTQDTAYRMGLLTQERLDKVNP